MDLEILGECQFQESYPNWTIFNDEDSEGRNFNEGGGGLG